MDRSWGRRRPLVHKHVVATSSSCSLHTLRNGPPVEVGFAITLTVSAGLCAKLFQSVHSHYHTDGTEQTLLRANGLTSSISNWEDRASLGITASGACLLLQWAKSVARLLLLGVVRSVSVYCVVCTSSTLLLLLLKYYFYITTSKQEVFLPSYRSIISYAVVATYSI